MCDSMNGELLPKSWKSSHCGVLQIFLPPTPTSAPPRLPNRMSAVLPPLFRRAQDLWGRDLATPREAKREATREENLHYTSPGELNIDASSALVSFSTLYIELQNEEYRHFARPWLVIIKRELTLHQTREG